jgi:hypothetical protein
MRDIWLLKNDAHAIIEELKLLGQPKRVTYDMLAKRLGIRVEDCHLKDMRAISQVISALIHLEKMLEIVTAKKERMVRFEDAKAKEDRLRRHRERMEAEGIAATERRIRRAEERAEKGLPPIIRVTKHDIAPNLAELQRMAGELNK